jgi:hypothetical protein
MVGREAPSDPASQGSVSRSRGQHERNSKRLFGNFDFLAVAVAIASSEDGIVNATDLSWELQVANPRVRSQLVALAEVGLLATEPPSGGKRWYVRQDSSFWKTCLELNERWNG